jgi:hypothetical protein
MSGFAVTSIAVTGENHPQKGDHKPPGRPDRIWKMARPRNGAQRTVPPFCRAVAGTCEECTYRHSEEGKPMDRHGEGWVVFAAVMLGVAGIMRIFDAI